MNKRTIKFRSWDKKLKAFHYWQSDIDAYGDIFWDMSRTEQMPISQFTGLLDRVGAEIYEKDLLEIKMISCGELLHAIYQVGFGFNGVSAQMKELITPEDCFFNIRLEWGNDFCLAYENRQYDKLAIAPKGYANDPSRNYSEDITIIGNEFEGRTEQSK